MKSHLIAIILLTCTYFASADMVALSLKEKDLRQKITESPTHEEVMAAFNSSHHLLYQEAIKWLILNRDLRTWRDLAAEKSRLKGNSHYLYLILDSMAEHPPEPDKPLALALKTEHLKMLAKKGEVLPPRYEYSYIDPPVDEVLYELLAKDLDRMPSSSGDTIEAARLLLRYHAPSEKLERLVENKAGMNKAEIKHEEILRPATHESHLPIKSEKDDDQSSVTQSKRSTYSWIHDWKTLSSIFVLLGILAYWRFFTKAR